MRSGSTMATQRSSHRSHEPHSPPMTFARSGLKLFRPLLVGTLFQLALPRAYEEGKLKS